MESVVVTAIRLNAVDLLDQPKIGRWNAEQPLVPGTVEHERLFRVHPLAAIQHPAHPSTAAQGERDFASLNGRF